MNERQEKIYEIVSRQGSVTVEQLTKELFASDATIRRDLTKMEHDGLIVRVWGGALLSSNGSSDLPPFVRSMTNIEAKKKIANNASSLIRNNMSVFMSSGTTVTELSKLLGSFDNLTVITNGLDIVNELNKLGVQVIVVGGELYEHFDFVGSLAESNIGMFNTDLFFFSCSGITADGFTSKDMKRLEVMKKMQENSVKTVLLCDTSKAGKKYTYKGFGFDKIDCVVMDSVPKDAALVSALTGKLLPVKK